MSETAPHRIVFANEKGGTGKSTTAVHVAIALAYQGAKVAALDLDPRQRTLFRYLENRAETERRRGVALPSAQFRRVSRRYRSRSLTAMPRNWAKAAIS